MQESCDRESDAYYVVYLCALAIVCSKDSDRINMAQTLALCVS